MPVKTQTPRSWTSPANTAMFLAAMAEHGRVLAQRIMHARKAKGWGRERLAREAGLSPKTILRLEKAEVDKPNPATYDKLAHALGVEVRFLDAGRPTLEDLQEQGGPLDRIERKLDDILTRLPPAPPGALGRRLAARPPNAKGPKRKPKPPGEDAPPGTGG